MAVETSGGAANRRQSSLLQQVLQLQSNINAINQARLGGRTGGQVQGNAVLPGIADLLPSGPYTVYTSPQVDTSPVTDPRMGSSGTSARTEAPLTPTNGTGWNDLYYSPAGSSLRNMMQGVPTLPEGGDLVGGYTPFSPPHPKQSYTSINPSDTGGGGYTPFTPPQNYTPFTPPTPINATDNGGGGGGGRIGAGDGTPSNWYQALANIFNQATSSASQYLPGGSGLKGADAALTNTLQGASDALIGETGNVPTGGGSGARVARNWVPGMNPTQAPAPAPVSTTYRNVTPTAQPTNTGLGALPDILNEAMATNPGTSWEPEWLRNLRETANSTASNVWQNPAGVAATDVGRQVAAVTPWGIAAQLINTVRNGPASSAEGRYQAMIQAQAEQAARDQAAGVPLNEAQRNLRNIGLDSQEAGNVIQRYQNLQDYQNRLASQANPLTNYNWEGPWNPTLDEYAPRSAYAPNVVGATGLPVSPVTARQTDTGAGTPLTPPVAAQTDQRGIGALVAGLASLLAGATGGNTQYSPPASTAGQTYLPMVRQGATATPAATETAAPTAEATVTPAQQPVVTGAVKGATTDTASGTTTDTKATSATSGGTTSGIGGTASGLDTTQGSSGSRYMADWSADELARITLNTVGRAMSAGEFDGWVEAFTQEHGGTPPWRDGPFDDENNLIDNLLALGESQRAAATGGPGSAVWQTGNVYQDRAVTPDFWQNAWYNRYSAPTYPVGMSGQPWSFDQYQDLYPGQLPSLTSPTAIMLNNSGADYSDWYPLLRRQYYNYQPVIDTSGNGGGGGYGTGNSVNNLAYGGARR